MFRPIRVNRPGMTLICRVGGLMRAEIIKGRLESADIPVMLDYESLGRVMGLTVDGLGEVRILVPDSRAQEARELLAEPPDESPDESPDELPGDLPEDDAQVDERL